MEVLMIDFENPWMVSWSRDIYSGIRIAYSTTGVQILLSTEHSKG